MNIPKSRLWLIPILAMVCLLAQPPRVESQCVTSKASSAFGSTFSVVKYLIPPTNCTRTLNNAASCDPTGPTVTGSLFASAMTSTVATTAVACGWICDCGPVTITEADGLPVELMSFSIEGGDAS